MMSLERERNASPYFQHQDGGIYRYEGTAVSSVDGSEWVIYKHIWPFEPKRYIRPIAEWDSPRFRRLSIRECHQIMHYAEEDKFEARTRIAAARAARKGVELKAD